MESLPFSGIEPLEFDLCIGSSKDNERNYLWSFITRKLRIEANSSGTKVVYAAVEDALASLPIDIVLQLLSYIHAFDLYHFTLTCRAFRSFLLDRDPETNGPVSQVWARSFEIHSDVPRGPFGWEMSARWAQFLFGPPICECCGGAGFEVYLGLPRKYCSGCAEHLLIPTDQVMRLCRSHRHGRVKFGIVERICLHSIRRTLGSYRERPSARHFFLHEDVQKGINFACAHCREENGSSSLQKWTKMREDMEAHAAGMLRNGNATEKWVGKTFAEHRAWQVSWYHERCNKKFKKFGYIASDVEQVSSKISGYLQHFNRDKRDLSQKGEYFHSSLLISLAQAQPVIDHSKKLLIALNRTDFYVHLPILTGIVATYCAYRLAQERNERVMLALKDYQHSLPPSEWIHLPLAVLKRDETMSEQLLTHFEVPDADSKSALSSSISDWRENVLKGLIKQLPSTIFHPETPIQALDSTSETSPLELAVVVFSCSACLKTRYMGAAFVGGGNILTHICTSCTTSYTIFTKHTAMEWSPAGHSAALALLGLVGMDPRTTTAKDMDVLDGRFFCSHCTYTYLKGSVLKQALTWRECIAHSVYDVRPDHQDPTWLLLGPDATELVKSRENTLGLPWDLQDNAWQCSHHWCMQWSHMRFNYHRVVQHVLDAHNITTPEIPHDILYCPDIHDDMLRAQPRRPFHYETEPGWKYHCLHCPDPRITPFWREAQVIGHVSVQHSVVDPLEGRDWTCFDIYRGEGENVLDQH